MPTRRPAAGALADPGRAGAFVVYVEGPRDRDILATWARRLSPQLSRAVMDAAFILGGRQPARAALHLRELRSEAPEATGVCILDADHHGGQEPSEEPGLTLFTWGRRHIESYLLVPSAIRRSLRMRDSDGGRAERLIREHLPDLADEASLRQIDAKRLLDRGGPLARLLSRPLTPGRIARAMHPDEFHPDIHELFAILRGGLGWQEAPTRVEQRRRGPSTRPPGRGIIP